MPVPTTLVKWSRYAWRTAEWTIPAGVSWLSGFLDAESEQSTITWRRVHVIYTRTTPTGTSEDALQWSMDIANITSGAVDNTWTTGDFTTVETALDTFHTAIAARIAKGHVLSEYRWYKREFNPASAVHPFQDSGPPVRRTLKSSVVTGATGMPYQVAQSVTERTGWAKHWGRFYLPPPPQLSIDDNGRLTSAHVTAVANAAGALYSTCWAAELVPVVPITQVNKTPYRSLTTVKDIQVDDIPDVIRSRRPRQPAIRTIVAP